MDAELPLTRREALAARFWRVGVCVALAVSHLLLPVERGFPLLRLFGQPLTACLAVSLVSFLILLLESHGRILRIFRRKHTMAQIVFVVALGLSSLMAPNIKTALSIPLAYFGAFVLNYATIVYLFETGYKGVFLRTVLAALLVAAAVGIADGVLGVKLDFYEGYAAVFRNDMGYGDFVGTRAFGTLGNPIIFGVAMMLGIPFAASHLRQPWRILLVVLLAVAAGVTVSRTVLLMSAPLLVGALILRAERRWVKLAGVFVAAGLVLVALSGSAFVEVLTGPWRDRLEGFQGQWQDRLLRDYDAEQNVAIRIEALKAVLEGGSQDSALSVVIGHGPKSGTDVARNITLRYDTLDNTYATLYFEGGIVALLAYLWVYGTLLWKTRRAMRSSFHWYGVLAFLASGFAFVSVYYVTFPLLVVTSTAILTTGSGNVARSRPFMPPGQATMPPPGLAGNPR